MRPLIIAAVLLLATAHSYAQDPHFTQPMAAPIYYNPAFAGTAGSARISAAYRSQWASVSGGYLTYNFSYDQPLDFLGGGIGIFGMYDDQAGGTINNTTVGAAYNYRLTLSDKLFLRAGAKGSYNNRVIDQSKLKPIDKHDPILERLKSHSFGDIGAGLLLYGNNFHIGLGVDHLLEPNFLGYGESRLARKYVAQGGYFWRLSREENGWVLNPYLVLQKKGGASQTLPGVNLHKGCFGGGISWRQTPTNPDAINFVAGFHKGWFKMAYSYDHTISRAAKAVKGSHELSLSFFLCRGKIDEAAQGVDMFQKSF